MSDSSTTTTTTKPMTRYMFGRREILTDEPELTEDNLLAVLRDAYNTHLANKNEMDYLYNYYKGKQPILGRTKNIRSDVLNIIVENRANAIVAFKTGYLVGEPIQYTSRGDMTATSEGVSRLNDFMVMESKAAKDRELVDWQNITGTAYRLVLPNSGNTDCPFEMYTLDPRYAFNIRWSGITKRLIASVYYTTSRENVVTFSIYTPSHYYEVRGDKIIDSRSNPLGMIPIVEYPANTARLGVFETVMPLLDAVNNLDSNALDGFEQFVQSLLVLYNCNIEEGTTATDIQKAGLILLKSFGDSKADVKVIAEQLDQTQTQVLKSGLLNAINCIVGMPSQGDGNTSDSSNNGAMMLKQGWQTAEARAKDSELIFKRSEMETLKIVLKICGVLSDIALKPSDISIKFTRRNYEAITEKSTVLTTLLGSGYVDPLDAFTVSGMFIDPEEASRRGIEWHDKKVETAQAVFQQGTEDVEDEPEEPVQAVDGRATQQDKD